MTMEKKAKISLKTITPVDGRYMVVFNVETPGCIQSNCAGFDATLVYADGSESIYSFAGWATGDTDSDRFEISRGVNSHKNIDNIKNIHEGIIADCYN